MKSLKILLCLPVIFLAFSCASAPTGPSKPGQPWLSEVNCPRDVTAGEKGKIVFRYQGDERPVYAEITVTKISGTGQDFDVTAPVNYRFENEYEIPVELSRNPTTWYFNFYVVDRKGRFSNEANCSMTVR